MTSALGTSAYVIGIVIFLGTALVYLRGSKDKGTIATLEASNRALNERVDVLEASEARLTARVALLETENRKLEAQRPSAEAIAALSSKVDVLSGALLGKGKP